MDVPKLVRTILIGRAKHDMTITYTDLASVLRVHPHSTALTEALYQVCRDDGPLKPILTSIVVHANSNGKTAGSGFYIIAKEFGRNADDATCLEEEQKAVFEYYKV